MAYIGRRPDEVFRAQADHDTFTGDGSTKVFDLSVDAPDNDADLAVFVDNVRQEPGSSKSYTIGADGSGNIRRITFVVAPAASAEIYVINPGRDTSLIDVADNAVTSAKIAGDAVTGAKLADDAVNSEHLTDGSVDNVHLAGSIANAKLTNSAITINGTSIALGASGEIVAGTDWQAVTVADGSTQLTAEAGKGYFLDTNAGVIEVKLPASPSRGDTFVFADYGNNFATNRAIIDTQGKLIDSTVGGVPDSDFVLETNGQIIELVYKDSTSGYMIKQNNSPSALEADSYAQYTEATGGTITTSGNFKIHSFTGDGCFVVSKAGNTAGGGDKVSYVVVAGGGGAGSWGGGGGGAGGFREGKCSSDPYTDSPLDSGSGLTITATTFPITVGGGGTAPANYPTRACGSNGSNSIFSTITSAGGGRGGNEPNPAQPNGNGSAGGAGGGGASAPGTGGAGNTPPVSPPQGSNGGTGGTGAGAGYFGGGGGGASAVGANAGPPNDGGPGGAGVTSHITGSPVVRSGGGGGGNVDTGDTTGGSGGGGAGGNGDSGTAGTAGTANTGGGGGGAGASSPSGSSVGTAGAGGKGIVIIRYKFQAG